MTFPTRNLLPVLLKLGAYLKEGVDYYAMMKASGMEINADVLSMFIGGKMGDWDPKISGVPLLDPDTRQAAARMLAGVAINISKVPQKTQQRGSQQRGSQTTAQTTP